jgi:hypothetical protein
VDACKPLALQAAGTRWVQVSPSTASGSAGEKGNGEDPPTSTSRDILAAIEMQMQMQTQMLTELKAARVGRCRLTLDSLIARVDAPPIGYSA